MSIDEIRNERLKKLSLLKERGVEPYPVSTDRTHSIKDALENFDELSEQKTVLTLSGRIMSKREHGGSAFVDIYDGTERIQIYLKTDEMGEESFSLFIDTADTGDFIESTGTFFVTKKGAKTLLSSSWTMLSKSLKPLPEEWYGFKDEEERFRKRYLDILMNPEVREVFELKSAFWGAIRNFLKKEGFLEVETPTLELTTGGAEATPFKTHHNDFDLDVYLRISVGELWQKRLMAAGFPKTFEIGRVYRNEGSSPEHLQEFTGMEFYAAYMDSREGMEFAREMILFVAKEVFGRTKFSTRGFEFDLSDEWKHLDYVGTVEEMTGVNVLKASEDEMEKRLSELGVEYEGKNRERLIDSLWKHCRKQISGPAYLMNHPKIVSPLSKALPENPELTERVQLILAGSEMTNGFSELNDPIDQRQRFQKQKELLEAGDSEAMMEDEDFVEMLEYGMPPTFGFGAGDRLFAFLVDKPIRETQLFPLMRPKSAETPKKDLKAAVAIINRGAGLERWQELNTVAHLTAAFGARDGKVLFNKERVETSDHEKIGMNIGHAILIKETDSTDKLRQLIEKAKERNLEVSEFIREMIETTNDNKISSTVSKKAWEEVEYLGVLVFGFKKEVEDLTKDFDLYK